MTSKNLKILIIGPQGSGKSTQAKKLSEFLKIPVISTGEIFRKLSSEGSEEGKRIKKLLDEGKLVDDQTTAELVKNRLGEEDCKNGFILDGYPRNMEQIFIFDPEFDKVLYFNSPEDVVVNRLLQRGRSDDTSDLIKIRLDQYYQQTQPLLGHYKNKGILFEIDASKSIEEVWEAVKEVAVNNRNG